jgi:hypothetical protein
MIFEWDARKAAANLRKHHIAFEDAATVFLDPLALTFLDPDHSLHERREGGWYLSLIASAPGTFALSVPAQRREQSEHSMKKESAVQHGDELRREYDLATLKGGVRGKYYHRATHGTNLVLIEPELANLFPDSEAVNRALRVLADAAQAATPRKPRRTRVG